MVKYKSVPRRAFRHSQSKVEQEGKLIIAKLEGEEVLT